MAWPGLGWGPWVGGGGAMLHLREGGEPRRKPDKPIAEPAEDLR